MTAEQFWLQWRKSNNKSVATKCLSEISCEFAESYATAQLAEKEREIERLKSLVMSLRPSTLEARAEAAEQRLQEAQAEIDRLQDGWTKTVTDEKLSAWTPRASYDAMRAILDEADWHEPIDLPMFLPDWLQERLENCCRLAAQKSGDDKREWLIDALYFKLAVDAVSSFYAEKLDEVQP